MRKYKLYETLIVELKSIGKFETRFSKLDLKRLNDIHQKYIYFVYKHSNLKNQKLMTMYFKRQESLNKHLNFCVDESIYKLYYGIN